MSLSSNYVPPEGPRPARIMVVGEGPGRNEAMKGRPFIGESGKLLDEVLMAIGMDRRDLFITNTTKYYPGSADKESYFFNKGAPTDALMQGIIELVGEINEVQPNVIVPLGNIALWALTGETGILNWRGSIMESTLVKGKKVIPTIHPAWFIRGRMFHKLPLLEWDFNRISTQSEFPEIRLPEAEFIVDPSPEEIEAAIERLLKADLMTVDTEWYAPEELAYIGFTDSRDWAITIPARSMTAYRAYKTLLESDVPKVFQNAAFDAVALHRIGLPVKNIKHDTMVAWHCSWTDLREKGLRIIGSVLTEWPFYKDDVSFIGKDDHKGQIYCCTDCVVEHTAIEELLHNEFAITGAQRGYEISMSISDYMIDSSQRGILCDYDLLMKLKKQHLDRANTLEATLNEVIGYTLNTRSPKQVAALVYDGLGIRRQKRSTAQDVLMDIAASTKDEAIKEILTAIIRVRQDLNMVSRYLNEDIVDRDGRIRTNWNLAGTRSGRLSTTEPWWNGWAMQTVPDVARSVCIADPGHVLIQPDYEQAEARVVAVKCHDYELLDAMEQGKDIHTILASQLPFGLSYDELTAMIEEKGKDGVPERYLAKKARHALNYVMGPGTFKSTVNREYLDTGVGIDMATAKALRNAYLEIHPALQAWWQEVYDVLREKKRIINAFGRVRNFIGRIDDDMRREAVSFYPQSSVADSCTISIAETMQEAPYAVIYAHMHDGALFQVPEERRDGFIEIVRRKFIRPMRIDKEFIEIPIEIKVGNSWGTMKRVA